MNRTEVFKGFWYRMLTNKDVQSFYHQVKKEIENKELKKFIGSENELRSLVSKNDELNEQIRTIERMYKTYNNARDRINNAILNQVRDGVDGHDTVTFYNGVTFALLTEYKRICLDIYNMDLHDTNSNKFTGLGSILKSLGEVMHAGKGL